MTIKDKQRPSKRREALMDEHYITVMDIAYITKDIIALQKNVSEKAARLDVIDAELEMLDGAKVN